MATYDTVQQLSLPLSQQPGREPAIADADVTPPRRPDTRKLPSEYTDAELLATVLGPSTTPLCERLTTNNDGFRTIGLLGPAELIDHGFTTGAVHRLSAVFEIAKRYGEEEFKPGAPLRGSADVYAHFRERLAAEPREHFYAVLLDNKTRKIRDVLLSLGSLTASIVHPRDCFHQIVRHCAAGVSCCHNYPSGDPTPSKEACLPKPGEGRTSRSPAGCARSET